MQLLTMATAVGDVVPIPELEIGRVRPLAER